MVSTPLLAILPLLAQLAVILVVPPVLELESSNAQVALPITISIPTLALLVEMELTQLLVQPPVVLVLVVLTVTVRPVLAMSAVPVIPITTCQPQAIVFNVLIPTVILVLTLILLNAQSVLLITVLSTVFATLPPLIQLSLKPEEFQPALPLMVLLPLTLQLVEPTTSPLP